MAQKSRNQGTSIGLFHLLFIFIKFVRWFSLSRRRYMSMCYAVQTMCTMHSRCNFMYCGSSYYLPFGYTGLFQVLDATSNEPWGPHGSHFADIAQAIRTRLHYHSNFADNRGGRSRKFIYQSSIYHERGTRKKMTCLEQSWGLQSCANGT